MLRVLQVVHSVARAGTEQLVYELAVANRHCISTAVLCLDEEGSLAQPLRAAGVAVYNMHRRPGIDLSQVRKISRVIRSFKPQVIHCHQYTPFFYGSLACLWAGTGRVLFTEHGRRFPDVVGVKRRSFNRLLARTAGHVTAVCRFVRRRLIEKEGIPSGRIEVVYNGVDVSRFDCAINKVEARCRLNLPQNCPIIVQVGTFRAVKDQATAIRSFARLRREDQRPMLVFAGDGPDLPHCHRLARELNLGRSVRFLSTRPDIPRILAAADIMLCTSLSEAHSVSLLEAMACRLPVVATDVGGNSETVLHGRTGLLAPAGDVEAISRCLLELLRNENMRAEMGLAGFNRVRQHFLRSTMHQRYLQIYHQLARHGRAA